MQNETMDFTDMLGQLRAKYIDHIRQRCPDIVAFMALCEQGDAGPAARSAMRFHAHALAGSGATYGFAEISKAGRALERALEMDMEEAGLLLLVRELHVLCCQAATP